MPFANNGGVRIHWKEQGSGSPLVLIMGHRYSSRMWYPAIPALAQHHRVISFDNRGTGRSDSRPRFELGDMVNDTVAVMDAAGVESAHVYGVSMGGGIAMELAMRHPDRVRSLILGCTRLKTDRRRRSLMHFIIHYLPPPLIYMLMRMRKSRRQEGSATDPEAAAMARDVFRCDPYSVLGVAAQSRAIARYSTTLTAASHLNMPSLILHGDEDQAVPYRYALEMAETLPNSRLETFNGAGHNYFLACRERANALVLEFLRQLSS